MSSDLDKSRFAYAGWIPTANSRLSFRHVGESRHPSESKYTNLTTDKLRLVICYQRRYLSDVLFGPVVHFICGIESAFWFVLTAQSIGVPGDTDELAGKVFIYKSKRDWREKGQPEARPRIDQMNELIHSLSSTRDTEIETLFAECTAHLQGTSDIELGYHLFRTGEIYFEKPKFNDLGIQNASASYAAEFGHDFDKWLADQAYFFVRDVTHAHQHHSRTSDTILILQEVGDDIRWRRNVVYSIYHYIIRSKRFSDARSLYQAMGILGYCKSFKSICSERYTEGQLKIPTFNDAALEQSLMARAEEIEAVTSEHLAVATIRMTRAANWRLFSLAFVAIITALLVMLVQPMLEHDQFPKLSALAREITNNLGTFVATLALILINVWALTSNDWQVNTRFGRDVLELSNFHRWSSIFFYFALALIVSAIVIYLSEPALHQLWDAIKAVTRLVFS